MVPRCWEVPVDLRAGGFFSLVIMATTNGFQTSSLSDSEIQLQQIDYVKYWKSRLYATGLRRCQGGKWATSVPSLDDEMFVGQLDLKFDWERHVLMAECLARYAYRKKLPSNKKPGKVKTYTMWTKNGPIELEQPYYTYFSGKLSESKEDDLFHESFSMTHYDERTHYKFSVGNFEAALRITKHIWQPRLEKGRRAKNNWPYVITPTCYEFLSGLQQLISGYTDDLYDRIESGEPNLPKAEAKWEGESSEPMELEYAVVNKFEPELQEAVPLELAKLDDIKQVEFVEHSELETIEWDTTQLSIEEPAIVQEQFETVEDFDSLLEQFKVEEPRWYPSFAHRARRGRKVPDVDDIYRTERNYFDDLAEVYLRIGRPDLVARISSPVRIQWLRTKVYKAVYNEFCEQEVIKRQWKPQSKETPLCIVNKVRNKALRMLSQYSLTMLRHRDKMEIFCHRGRFAYLKTWDTALWIRQRRIIMGMETTDLRFLWEMYFAQSNPIVSLPSSYPEQADSVLHWIQQALEKGTVEAVAVALKAIGVLVDDWRAHDMYEPWRTGCVREQSSDQPVGAAAPGPSGGGASSKDPVGAAKVDKPITKGETKVTLTTVDQRVPQKTAVPQEKKGVKHPSSIPESFYDMLDLVKRPMMIDRLTWSIGDDLGTELKTWTLPQVYFSAKNKPPVVCQNLNAAYVVAMFGAVRFDMKIRIQINTTKFQQGMLMFVFKPYYSDGRKRDVFHNCTQFPHVKIDASTSNPVELSIPWTSFRDAFPVYADPHNEFNYFGTLHGMVWNKLQTGAVGSTDASITMWMWLENFQPIQLANPKDPGTVNFASAIRGLNKDKNEKIIQQPILKTIAYDHWSPQALETVLDVGKGLVQDVGADLVESLLQRILPGNQHTKPQMSMPPAPVKLEVMPNSAWGKGVDISTVLALDPLQAVKPSEDYAGKIEFRDLIKQWSRMRVATWESTDAENARIVMWPVCPMVKAVNATKERVQPVFLESYSVPNETEDKCELVNNERTNFVMERQGTMLDYLSNFFLYWRGNLRFKLEIVKTNMHSGRLLIRYEPYGTDGTATKECQKMATPGIVWDVQEKQELEFEAPYFSAQPWLQTQFKSGGAISVSHLMAYCCGGIEITVVNRLKYTTGVANNVQINIYIGAGQGFQFKCMSPLDGIIAVRDHPVMYSKMESPLKNWTKEIQEVLNAYLEAPMKLEWTGTGVQSGKTRKWRKPVDEKMFGPFVYRTPDQISRIKFKDFVENVIECLKEAGGKKHEILDLIPSFTDFDSAYRWVNDTILKLEISSDYEIYMKEIGEGFSHAWAMKRRFWYAIAIMKEHAWKVTKFPTGGYAEPFIVLLPKEEGGTDQIDWKPQSNDTATGDSINPFTHFLQPRDSKYKIGGNDYMNMYKCMQRYMMWHSRCEPPQLLNTAEDNWHKENSYRTMYEDVYRMDGIEVKNYYFEVCMPVTPFTPYHKVGDSFNYWTNDDGRTNYEVAGNFRLPLGNYGGDAGTLMNITSSRYLGELFTFWRGSMRYRFEFPSNRDEAGKPWNVKIIYHPRNFCTMDEMFSRRLVHSKRIRDMSRMGVVMYSGELMNTLDVQVPYESKYEVLSLDDTILDETTLNGTLFMYIPVRRAGKFAQCVRDSKLDFTDMDIYGLDFNVWTAIGEDMKFEVPRAAPRTFLWPLFWEKGEDIKERTFGYDTLSASAITHGDDEKHQNFHHLSVVKELRNMSAIGESQTNPIRTVTTYRNSKRIDHTAVDDTKMDNNQRESLAQYSWRYGFAKPPAWAPQADDCDITEVKQLVVPPAVASTSREMPSQTEEVTEDDIDGTVTSILQASRQLPKMASDFCNIASTVTGSLEKLQETIKLVGDTMVAIKEGTDKATESVTITSSKIGTMATYAFNATRVALFFKGINDMMNAEEWSERWIPIAQSALALGLSPDVVVEAGNWLMGSIGQIFGSEKVHENGDVKPQSFEDYWDRSWTAFLEENASLLKLVAAGVVTIMTFYFTSSAPLHSRVSSFAGDMLNKLKNFAIVGSAIKTLDWLFKWLAEVIKTACITVADWFSGGMVTAQRMANHYPEVIEWLKSIEIYKQENIRSRLTWDSEARLALWKKLDEGDLLLEKISSKTGNLFNTIMRGMAILQSAHDNAILSRSAAPFREDPFHICLVGEAGIGKSSVLTFILGFMADSQDFPNKHRYYTRGEEDEYWTNYNGQPVVIIDDLFQDKKARAIKELIKMKSNCAYPLNMASLEEKGRHFISKLIGSTSNIAFPRPDDIMHPQALWRRRNMLVKVRAIEQTSRMQGANWDKLRFDILNPCPSDGQTEVYIQDLKMEELLVLAAESFAVYRTTQQTLVFTGLRGKEISEIDYGEVETKPEGEQTLKGAVEHAIKSGLKLSKEAITEWVLKMSDQEYQRVMKDTKLSQAILSIPAISAANNLRIDELQFHLIRNALIGDDQIAIHDKVVPMLAANAFKEIQKEPGVVELIPLVKEVERPDLGVVIVDNRQEMKQYTLKPQAYEDILNEDPEVQRCSPCSERAEKLREKAAKAVGRQTKLTYDFKDLVARINKLPPGRRRVVIADDQEIRNFVVNSFHSKNADINELVRECKQIFNDASQSKVLERELKKAVDASFARLFSVEYSKYWKEKDGDWIMEFTEAEKETDIGEELYLLYEYMIAEMSQDQINEQKRLCKDPVKLKDCAFITFVEKSYKKLKAKVSKWFDEHPKITMLLKLGGALAVLFGGYKLVQIVCPKIIEKFKTTVAGVFGWATVKIGPERIEKLKTGSLKAVDCIRRKSKEYYDYVRALMITSNDPELIEAASNPEAVELMAEGLESQVKSAKNLVAMKTHLRPEGKRVFNAYMLGQDRLKSEGETLAQSSAKIPRIYHAQGSDDPNATVLRNNVLSKNMVRIAILVGNTYRQMGGIFIGGRYLMVPHHFWQGVIPGTLFSVTSLKDTTTWDVYQPEKVVKIPNQDVSIFAGAINFGQFKKITHHFISRKDLNFRYTAGTLNVPTAAGMIVHTVDVEKIMDMNYDLRDGTLMQNIEGWSYKANTQEGDCGGILMVSNTAIKNKLLGIHVCGASAESYGGSALITKECLEEAMEKLPPVTNVLPTDIVPQGLITKVVDQMKIQPQGNFELLGAVASSKETRLPHKTEIHPSVIHDKVREHVTEPAVLTTNDPRNESGKSPLLKAIEKYGKPTLPFPPKDLDYIANDILEEVLTWKVPMEKRLLTDHEAVFGNELIDFCDRMNLAASPGYPWTLGRPSGEKGKAWLYDINSEDGIIHNEYRHCYQAREKLARAGMRKISIWTDCLKDERRPLAKIKAGKTRAFMLPPADFVQLCRKYFMAFCVTFYTNNITSFSAVGMDPYSYHWTRLIHKLKKKSNLGFGGDFHSFDGIFDPNILIRVIKIINQWYKYKNPEWEPEDDLVREVLAEEMIHTVHICLNSIYRKFQGNPSGNPLTVIINTFAHCFYLRLAWMGLAREHCPEMVGMHDFHSNVAEIYYGDDGLLTVTPRVKDWFNLEKVSEFLSRYRIEYTSEQKTEETYGVRYVTECTFLKNGFSKLKGTGLWLAPIAEDTIFELTNWVRKSDDPLGQLRENLENARRFAFHHGRKFYDGFCAAVNDALRERGLKGLSYSYDLDEAAFITLCGS